MSLSPLAKIHKPKFKNTLQHASDRRVQDPLQPPGLLEMDREDVVVEVVRDERCAAGEQLDLRHVLGALRAVVDQDGPFRAADGVTNCVAERCAAFSREVVSSDGLVLGEVNLWSKASVAAKSQCCSAPQAPMESPKNSTRLP